MRLYTIRNPKHFYLKVDDIHTLYVEESGNPNGIPLICLHGGPGIPMGMGYQKMYNGNIYKIITFHQRGCGLSTPTNCLIKNTTKYMIDDMEKIREILCIKKWIVEGISWGSTLAVLYGISHSDKLLGLVIGGFSTMNNYTEKSTQACAPDIYKKWMYKRTDKQTMEEYIVKLRSKDPVTRNKYTKMWNVENELFNKMDFENINTSGSKKTKFEFSSSVSNTLALMECYYYMNKGFVSKNYIFNNAYKLNTVPGFIVHGRFDLICSAENSYNLSKKWTRAKLIITEMAGHSFKNINNAKAWMNAFKTFDWMYEKRHLFYSDHKCTIKYHEGMFRFKK